MEFPLVNASYSSNANMNCSFEFTEQLARARNVKNVFEV